MTRPSSVDKQPFFLVGLGRSGSTRLYGLLSEHPNIAMTSESGMFDLLYYSTQWASIPKFETRELELPPTHRAVPFEGLVLDLYQETFNRVVLRHAKAALQEFYVEFFADREFTHWGDKLLSPDVAVELQVQFPNAKYLVLVRDPRALSASLARWREREDLPIASALRGQRPAEWAAHWQITYLALDRYLHDRLIVRYEDLVTEPLRTLTSCLDYLGLDGAEAALERGRTTDLFDRHATSSTPEDSLDRWRRDLSADDIRAVESAAAEGMQRYGYGA